MGQKVNPHGLRVGVIKDWDSRWFAEGDFADNLVEDYNIRKFLKKKLYASGVSGIEIEREAEEGSCEAHREEGLHRHQGDQETGQRGTARRREHRTAA